MRLKVGDTRVAVSAAIRQGTSEKINGIKRGMLYDIQSQDSNNNDYTTTQIEARISEANKLYKVFFRADDIKTLKSHFENIVERVYKSIKIVDKDSEELERILTEYTGYKYQSKDNKEKFASVNWFSYKPVGKDIKWVMKNYVHEYMNSCWYEEKALEAATTILTCICDGENYKKKVAEFAEREDIVSLSSAFIEAVKKCEGKPFIYGTAKLESLFEALVVRIRDACDDKGRNAYKEDDEIGINTVIKGQINATKEIECLSIKKNEDVFLSTNKSTFVYRFKYVENKRLDAILIRMRQNLKRGTNRDIAIALLKGLASGNFSTAVDDLITNKKKELAHFVDTINKDYYKFSIVKSVKNMDVKAQVYKINTDEAKEVQNALDSNSVSTDKNNMYRLSISNNVENKGFIETLEKYTLSQEESDNILIKIKKLLYEYFMPEYKCDKDEIFKAKKLWKFPKVEDVYFDEGFECKREQDKNRKEAQDAIKQIWAESKVDEKGRVRVNQSLLKKRIGYVNVGRYISLASKSDKNSTQASDGGEEGSIEKYWISYIKDFVEKNYVNVKTSINKDACLASSMLLSCWKSIIRFMCGKFIDIGKMVYHVAMPDDMSIKTSAEGGTNYGVVQPAYVDGISSFVYEDISAEDNLQRSIAGATVAAVNNFTRAAFDDRVEDCLLLKKQKRKKDEQSIEKCMKKNAIKQILRFYGGMSYFGQNKDDGKPTKYDEFTENAQTFIDELVRLLAIIRNENFHYTPGHKKCERIDYAQTLLKYDINRYKKLVKMRYYTNNVACFYDEEKIKELVNKLYGHTDVGEAQIPAFQSVWKRVDLPKDFIEIVKANNGDKKAIDVTIIKRKSGLENEEDERKHLGAVYFLLKEIYYRDFILDKEKNALKKFNYILHLKNKKIKEMVNSKQYNLLQKLNINSYAESNFMMYIDNHSDEYSSFGLLCQKVMNQYGVQNTNREEEKYKHFKMLICKYTKLAFIEHLKENYAWLFEYQKKEETEGYLDDAENVKIQVPFANLIESENKDEQVLEEKNVSIDEIYEVYKMAWYTLGHYIHPRQLNLLIGECKNYIQYKTDIAKRAENAGQSIGEEIKEKNKKRLMKVRDIIGILNFVKSVTGGVTGDVRDYYEAEIDVKGEVIHDERDAYASYLSNYIAFEKNGEATFEAFKNFCSNTNGTEEFDLYADKENPKILHNIEFARMYAGGEIPLLNLENKEDKYKITKDEVNTSIKESKNIAEILNKGRCESKDEQERVVEYQQLRGRITLNDVTNIYEIVSELLGKLVSLSYLRERDQMYLLLGFYYVMLQGKSEWIHNDRRINCGLVLYQIISVFDFGIKFVHWEKEDKEYVLKQSKDYEMLSNKLVKFYNNHKSSYKSAIRLFHNDDDKYDISDLRNYVDHLKYYSNKDKSIVELYSDYYTKVFGYSTRLRQSVINNFTNILDSYFIEAVPKIQPVNNPEPNMPKIKLVLSNKFESKKHDYKLKDGKKVQLPAKSEKFVEMLRAVLEYKVVGAPNASLEEL